MAKPTVRSIRCAIYTRKSTEEGLEQEFNSLDAQREACGAYVTSQRHEGWTLLPEVYDDGGYSGGNMERPGLRRLLAEVAAGKVDVIVVYKVDRLTRALSDFARIVDVLDGAGASFVSVTQSFNTTTSMGRLTLNVLLSFAQFEREVTGERIRDKVAASKRKGMWMGGSVPLGYDVRDRKLLVNEGEAATVRLIFDLYERLGSILNVAIELANRDIRSKRRIRPNGDVYGDRLFSTGALAHILKNRLYLGEVVHKGESFPGEHAAIIDRSVWDRVQAGLHHNRVADRLGSRANHPSPLAGMISDPEGQPMTTSHSKKGSRRYRYYVTAPEQPRGKSPPLGWRLPAGEIEGLVQGRLASWLSDEAAVIGEFESIVRADQLHSLLAATGRVQAQVATTAPSDFRALLLAIDAKVAIASDQVAISFSLSLLGSHLGAECKPSHNRCTIFTPASLVRRGQELRLSYPPKDRDAPARHDVKLIGLIAKAEAAHCTLSSGTAIDPSQRSHLSRLARLKFLAPDIVSAILEGRQPAQMSARKLLRAQLIPLCWDEQRETFGFG